MTTLDIESTILSLTKWFQTIKTCTIATSGGIDSMLLAYIANKTIGKEALIVHSTSVSVPILDANRIREYANKYCWHIEFIDAGELNNESYRNNPVNRCYYCKSCLFEKLKKLNHGVLITGTNLDDLGDYRPGLIAAKEQNVRQPYVELNIDKAMIRKIANYFQLHDLKDIPASPCLSSRIETGVKIDINHLQTIDKIENIIRLELKVSLVRFRIRNDKVVLELEPHIVEQLTNSQRDLIINKIKIIITPLAIPHDIQISTYEKGSAFIGVKNN